MFPREWGLRGLPRCGGWCAGGPPLRRPSVFIATWEVVIFFVGLNLIDYAIVALFALSVLIGLHRGTVATGLNLLALGLSLVIAKL